MPTTTRLGLTYPTEWQKDWWDQWVAMLNQFDLSVYSTFENPNLFLTGGGEITLDAGADELTWSEDLLILNMMSGGVATIAADTLAGFTDGKIAYIDVNRPMNGSVVKTLQLTNAMGNDSGKVFIAMRRGSVVYCRNHANRAGFQVVDKWDTKKLTTASAGPTGGTVSGTINVGIDIGTIGRLKVTAIGNTTDSSIQFFSDAGLSDQLYLAANLDCYSSPYEDLTVWFAGPLVGGLHYQITNNGANASTYEVELLGMGRMG